MDYADFHIATPLPCTPLMEECIEIGLIDKEHIDYSGAYQKRLNKQSVGYTTGIISTNEFSNYELQILRAFEWDRINFKTEEKKKKIAKIQNIALEELEQWRKETRGNVINNIKSDI